MVQKNLVNSPYGNKYKIAYVKVSRDNKTGESRFKLHLTDGIYCFYTDATKKETIDGKEQTVLDDTAETGVDESNLNNDMFLISTDKCTGMQEVK